jgi:hypothetical protein
MERKLKRRELVQAGVVTGAALALGGTMAGPARPEEGGNTAHVQSVLATLYFQHVGEACDSTWKNPACSGDPGRWLSCSSATPHSCGHNQ